ncbi:restriction endonuclease subunit S [Pantoea ananatis]|uniref:restriction endonuclease subunit S n=1 Tax=Pantoea ananas TaxID=553 RepID=UPI001B3062BD|nr:restriction endonuclease subunit S [Pantoea ananatis]
MMDKFFRTNSSILVERLDPNFYQPSLVENDKLIKSKGWVELQSLYNASGIGNTSAVERYYSDAADSIPYISGKVIKSFNIDLDGCQRISLDSHKNELTKSTIRPTDVLVIRKGDMGNACVVPSEVHEANCSSEVIYLKMKASSDPYYLVSYLNCKQGQKAFKRLGRGTIIPGVSLLDVPRLPIPKVSEFVQKHIGDKVRQAEQLRAWAKRLALSIEDLLTSSDDYLSACRTPEKKTTRPQLIDLSNRLDPKYYGNKAIAVHRFTRKTGTPLAALIKSVANGFEERSFIENGLAYITVSEVSSGRLDAQSAPKISKSIDVPQKAVIHETCVLVVRTGSIGTAVKVHALDKGCAISSHLIRLEFEDEETAAAVAVFLNSSAGKVLLHKISYGAVQPQIGQEELLALNIPEYVLNEKTQCLALLNSYELAIRASKSLTVSAKNLVEALIEGQLTERQLVEAQQALEDGDNSLDQAILSKLSAEGYAIEGATPLFSDVDELYRLLEDAAQAEAEE